MIIGTIPWRKSHHLPLSPVGGTEHVVGTEAEEGGVPPVVIMSDNGPDGVGTEGLVRAVHLLEVLQLSEPVAAASPTGSEEAEQEG